MPEGFLDVKGIIVFGSVVFFVQAIVSMTKEMKWPKKLPTLVYACLLAAVVYILVSGANSTAVLTDWRTYLLALFNGVIVAFNAAKNTDVAIKSAEDKKQQGAL